MIRLTLIRILDRLADGYIARRRHTRPPDPIPPPYDYFADEPQYGAPMRDDLLTTEEQQR